MHYDVHGPDGAPALMLSAGLGGSAHYWAPQIPILAERYRVIAYDHYGTGRSPGQPPEGYTMADMAMEAAAVLDQAGVTRCAFVGHALGGLIGLELAFARPDLFDRLVLVNAWAKTHPHTLRCFDARISLLRDTGIEAFVKAQPLFLYPADWLAARQDWLAEQDAVGLAHFQGTQTVLRRIAAIRDFDIADRAPSIAVPSVIIAAHDDLLVPSTCSATLAALLPQAKLMTMERGGHACNVTEPDAFNRLLDGALN